MFESRGTPVADKPPEHVSDQPAGGPPLDADVSAEMQQLCSWVSRVAQMPTGALFARAVAGMDLSRLNGYSLVDMVIAGSRLVSWAQAVMLAAVAEMAHCPTSAYGRSPTRRDTIDPHARDELAAALCCTPRGADQILNQAYTLTEDLPAVYDALRAGHIDLLRARILITETLIVDDPTTRQQIVRAALPGAAHLTPGQLTARLRRSVLAADPQAACRREQRAVADRRVVAGLDSHGAATLAGYGLPAHRAMAAEGRIAAIARAARKAGDPRTLDALRADTMLDMLLGEYTPPPDDPTDQPPATTPPTPPTPPATPPAATPQPPDTPAPLPFPVPVPAGTVNLHINLTTLLGLDDLPAHVTAWGPIIAETARLIADQQPDSTWELYVHDADGALIHRHRLHRHPTVDQAAFVRARDITCRAPGCPVPAQRAELDHTIPWSAGGLTTEANMGALCVKHHHLKHEGGWELHQEKPGTFTWTTGLGRTYTRHPDTTILLHPDPNHPDPNHPDTAYPCPYCPTRHD